MTPDQLILASASPRRAELLARMGLAFEVRPTHVEEDDSGRHGPTRMVLDNAKLKASTLAVDEPKVLVLGSDTTVALGEQILSKPADLDEAFEMLSMLSGQSHVVHTAVALEWRAGEFSHAFVETSEVRFKTLTEETIQKYIRMVNPLDKAGAYGIQVGQELIIDRVTGSVENVMGLPIQTLERCLAEHGFDFRN